MSFANLSQKFNGIIISALILAIWNLISLFVELALLKNVYEKVPELKKDLTVPEEKKKFLLFDKIRAFFKGWAIYSKQGILCLPGLSLATLFLTVLSFDSITIGYAKSQDISESAISIIQGIYSSFF